jgi:peptidyl-prolyl cis-trans isomerase A (cyclophilin A)
LPKAQKPVVFPTVRFVATLLALASPLHAELRAVFQTTVGNVQVTLQYDTAPQAVANFMTLAQGTRGRLDPQTGAITHAPLYVGEKFYRVENEAGFKIAQTGSGVGNTTGEPGFTFKDEISTLTHVPYVLSMANRGPNTNGSQIFLTGNTSIPQLDGVHTIFGLITDTASRSVIDAIVAAGSNGSTITGLTFQRTDPAAEAFNEFAQDLPTVTCPKGNLAVTRNVSATWTLGEPHHTGDIFRAFKSTTLATGSWSKLPDAERHNGIPPEGFSSVILPVALDDASAQKAFYNFSLVKHPGACAPSWLADKILVMDLGGSQVYPRLRYEFDETGVGGVGFYFSDGNNYVPFPFSLMDLDTSAHAFSVIVFNENQNTIAPILRFDVGCDALWGTSAIFARHATYQQSGNGWSLGGRGNAALTR